MKNKKWWMIGGAMAVVVILVVSLVFLIQDMVNSATLSVTVAPSIASVIVDGREYGAAGTYKIAPGEYEVEIVAEGFKSAKGIVMTKAGETATILTYLEPEKESNWYETHPEDALIMGEVKNAETVKALEKLAEKNPILDKLPYSVDYYTADYSMRVSYQISYETFDDGYELIIKDYSGGNYERALSWVREQGVDTTIVTLKYEDLSGQYEGGYAG